MNEDRYSLDRLADVVVPDPVSWWPPAIGWQTLLAIVAIWLTAWGVLALIRWRRNAYRRAALSELASINAALKSAENPTAAVVDLARLLKRVALAAYPRDLVASLTGNQWLAFLDRTSGGGAFVDGPGSILGTASQSRDLSALVGTADREEVVAIARRWIASHPAEVDGC